jgi:hypothetical protein
MKSSEEQKLDEFLQHTEIRTNVSEWADEASEAIWEDIDSRISNSLEDTPP